MGTLTLRALYAWLARDHKVVSFLFDPPLLGIKQITGFGVKKITQSPCRSMARLQAVAGSAGQSTAHAAAIPKARHYWNSLSPLF
jgi:hypothetical protein